MASSAKQFDSTEIRTLAQWCKVAKYNCRCGNRWKIYGTRGGKEKCKTCHSERWPYKLRWPKEDEPGYCRMFGTFRCEDCQNTWYSGNAWNGYGQQCLQCKIMIMPHLQPLRRGKGEIEGPPHVQELCGRCQKLGRNCRGVPSGDLSTMMGSLQPEEGREDEDENPDDGWDDEDEYPHDGWDDYLDDRQDDEDDDEYLYHEEDDEYLYHGEDDEYLYHGEDDEYDDHYDQQD